MKNLYSITSWGKLVVALIMLGIIGFSLNLVFLLNKEDRAKFLSKIKNKLKRQGE